MTFKELRSAKTPTTIRRYYLYQKAKGIFIFFAGIALMPFIGLFGLLISIIGVCVFFNKKRLYDMLGYQSEIDNEDPFEEDDLDYNTMVDVQTVVADEMDTDCQKTAGTVKWRDNDETV